MVKMQANVPKKQARTGILIQTNRPQGKLIKRHEGNLIIYRKIHQENISFLNIYVPNLRAPTFKELLKFKRYIEELTLIVGDFNIH